MPESPIRRKRAYTAPKARASGPTVNPPWFLPVMLGLFVIGLAWIVVYYLSQGAYPIAGGFGAKNLFVGFGIVLVGFAMTTRWR